MFVRLQRNFGRRKNRRNLSRFCFFTFSCAAGNYRYLPYLLLSRDFCAASNFSCRGRAVFTQYLFTIRRTGTVFNNQQAVGLKVKTPKKKIHCFFNSNFLYRSRDTAKNRRKTSASLKLRKHGEKSPFFFSM
jgi:hypothetical protein